MFFVSGARNSLRKWMLFRSDNSSWEAHICECIFTFWCHEEWCNNDVSNYIQLFTVFSHIFRMLLYKQLEMHWCFDLVRSRSTQVCLTAAIFRIRTQRITFILSNLFYRWGFCSSASKFPFLLYCANGEPCRFNFPN